MKCNGTKKGGEKCEANAVKDSEFCYFHNPDISKEEKREAQTKGGQARALTLIKPLPELALTKPEDTILLLADTISRVRAGTLDIRTANSLGFLSDKLLRAFEITQLTEKVEVIERLIIERKTTKTL
jgi:hypothetical protein